MSRLVVADTGPIVALFHETDIAHRWAFSRFKEFTEPLVTCEAVITEALHLLRKTSPAKFGLLTLWQRGLLRITFSAESEKTGIRKLLDRFGNVRCSSWLRIKTKRAA